MTNLSDLTTGELHRIISIKEQIEKLRHEIDSIAGGSGRSWVSSLLTPKSSKRRKMSAAGKAAIAAAARARWAKFKGTKSTSKAGKTKDKRNSPATYPFTKH
jgi:hypothetical protein